ncbi:MAG: bifunctional glutamate N-acetyltransferase/amino-acid acetyltransferase ArgJ [Verrucomicrobiota bacterium]
MNEFSSQAGHRAWLVSQSQLPQGFRVGTRKFAFDSVELKKASSMTLTVIALNEPTEAFSCLFTTNSFPGAPILVGREVAASGKIGAILVNNKISNVCAPDGVEDCRATCDSLAELLEFQSTEILPGSTGVIGWKLPVPEILEQLPAAVADLQATSILPAAEGIMTTDLYPKVRSQNVGDARVVGIAKGAGMIEPNLATMLVYLLTDAIIAKDELDAMFRTAVRSSFNRITIDSDQSTSDIAAVLSSGTVAVPDMDRFQSALNQVCQDLALDLVRNGEGVKHVVQIAVREAPDSEAAHRLAKDVANSPLVQTAICGNDPNIGRLLMALGKNMESVCPEYDVSNCQVRIGGRIVFENGACIVNGEVESQLSEYLKSAALYETQAPDAEGKFHPPVNWPTHERLVEIEIILGVGDGSAIVWGSDRTHEYITENADYRS